MSNELLMVIVDPDIPIYTRPGEAQAGEVQLDVLI